MSKFILDTNPKPGGDGKKKDNAKNTNTNSK